MVCFWANTMCCLKCVFCCWMKHCNYVYPSNSLVSWNSSGWISPFWFSVWLSICEWVIGISHLDCTGIILYFYTQWFLFFGTYRTVFIEAKFTIGLCSSAGGWIKKRWYLHTVEYDSATKTRNLCHLFWKWMNFETIMLTEVSQMHKLRCCSFSYVRNLNDK